MRLHRSVSRGFTLIEVMFAIIILATAMTMVAGALYFGIHQTNATNDESHAAETGRSAAALLDRVMTAANTPETGKSFSPLDTLALSKAVLGSAISPADPRYAWVAMYQRDTDSRLATVYIIVVRAQTGDAYTAEDLQSFDPTSVYPPTLMPRGVDVQLTDGGPGGVDKIQLGAAGDVLANAAAPDSFVVINLPGVSGQAAGRIYRLGNLLDAATHTFALAPGSDLAGPSDNLIGTALIVGRPYRDRTKPAEGFDGTAQDIAIYRTFIALK